MGALHETLAVENELQGAFSRILAETGTTFTKRGAHFQGGHKQYEPFDEKDAVAAEALTEHQELVTTVDGKLDYMMTHVVKYLDVVAQKDATNQVANADLVVDGVLLKKSVPATTLLGLENKLKQVREVLMLAPTLRPGMKWEKDGQRGEGIWKATNPEQKLRTTKQVQSKIVAPATDRHPAQVETWNEDVPIGKYVTEHWSGEWSPGQKSNMMARLDALSHAVKQARMRANATDVVKTDIGRTVADFIMGRRQAPTAAVSAPAAAPAV